MLGRYCLFTILLLLVVPLSPSRAEDPEFNGRKLSTWLNQLREDPIPRKRRAAIVAIGQIAADNKDAIPVMLQAVGRALKSDANPVVRQQAATVLGQQKPEHAAAAIADLSESLRVEKDAKVRQEVATTIGRLGRLGKPAVLALVPLLKDADAGVRAAVADALGRIGSDAKATTPELMPLLKDPEKSVRQAAVFALGRVEPDDTINVSAAIVGMLKSETDSEFRREVIVTLGFLGDRSTETVQALASALKDPNAELRQQTVLALSRFGGAAKLASAELTRVFKEDVDKTVRTYAVHALSQSYGTDAKSLIPLLTERLKADTDFEVRIVIVEELGSLGAEGKEALPALREARRDPQIKVREAAAEAIKRIEKPTPPPMPTPKP